MKFCKVNPSQLDSLSSGCAVFKDMKNEYYVLVNEVSHNTYVPVIHFDTIDLPDALKMNLNQQVDIKMEISEDNVNLLINDEVRYVVKQNNEMYKIINPSLTSEHKNNQCLIFHPKDTISAIQLAKLDFNYDRLIANSINEANRQELYKQYSEETLKYLKSIYSDTLPDIEVKND